MQKVKSMKLEPYLVFRGKGMTQITLQIRQDHEKVYEPKNENNNSSKILFLEVQKLKT